MTHKELIELITEVQQHQSELDDVEVKSAQRGTPRRMFESLSSFANRTTGGVILFGLDENHNFEVVGVDDAHRLQEEISHLAASEMEPALRPEFTVEEVEGKTVVSVEVPGVAVNQRPCYYKPAGLQKGSYIRVGNTNRQMNDYEIFGYVSARTQPTFDEEPVPGTTVEDLDRVKLEDYLTQLKRARAQPIYLTQPFEKMLSQLRIVREVDGVVRPTLAGLLTFGKYPLRLSSHNWSLLSCNITGRRRRKRRHVVNDFSTTGNLKERSLRW
jgi:ATP-dependent DNA helicase RecG